MLITIVDQSQTRFEDSKRNTKNSKETAFTGILLWYGIGTDSADSAYNRKTTGNDEEADNAQWSSPDM